MTECGGVEKVRGFFGLMYATRDGVSRDYNEAVKWFRRPRPISV